MKKFILPEGYKSNKVLNHTFQDGVLYASDDDAKKMERVLVRHFGVKMENVEDPAAESTNEADSSLTVASTKHGQSNGDEEE